MFELLGFVKPDDDVPDDDTPTDIESTAQPHQAGISRFCTRRAWAILAVFLLVAILVLVALLRVVYV